MYVQQFRYQEHMLHSFLLLIDLLFLHNNNKSNNSQNEGEILIINEDWSTMWES